MRVIFRWIPGFIWVQFIMVPHSWRWGKWWAYRGIAKTHAIGPFRLVTMRTDRVERAKREGDA